MTADEFKTIWLYFCSLSDQLNNTTNFVDHSVDSNNMMFNAKTFSHEFVKLIMLASSEFEVIGKELCVNSGIQINKNDNIIIISKAILNKYPNIVNTVIHTSYTSLKPLENWKIIIRNGKEQVFGIDWWQAHNDLKHERSTSYHKATLENCVISLAALMVLEMYLANVLSIQLRNDNLKYFINNYAPKIYVSESGDPLPDFV